MTSAFGKEFNCLIGKESVNAGDFASVVEKGVRNLFRVVFIVINLGSVPKESSLPEAQSLHLRRG